MMNIAIASFAAVIISDDLKDCVTDAYGYTGGATGAGYASFFLTLKNDDGTPFEASKGAFLWSCLLPTKKVIEIKNDGNINSGGKTIVQVTGSGTQQLSLHRVTYDTDGAKFSCTVKGLGLNSGTATLTVMSVPLSTTYPKIYPLGGTYGSPQKVTITHPANKILYTLKESLPYESWDVYTEPVLVSESATLRAVAYFDLLRRSKIASATYTIMDGEQTVKAEPEGGIFGSMVNVTLSMSEDISGVRFYYTLDNSEPDVDSGTMTFGDVRIPLSLNSPDITLKAIAVDASSNAVMSSVLNENYKLLPPPSASPAGGNYSSPVDVYLSCPFEGAEIHYEVASLKYETPSINSPLYTGPLRISSTTALSAVAYYRQGSEDIQSGFIKEGYVFPGSEGNRGNSGGNDNGESSSSGGGGGCNAGIPCMIAVLSFAMALRRH